MTDFSAKLLSWYDAHKRDLPWRKTKDPYKIWLSEIMLQQTTVKTVIPYYQNFLKKFPDLKSVATAGDSDLIHAWSGLGYYQRIRNFKKACSQVISDYQGKIPSSFESLITLSGLGPYTAAAVASIAFDEKVAVVDGNVIRVLSRLFAYSEDMASGRSKKFFLEKATLLMTPSPHPGDFNQAMMELGATVCTPKKPLCLLCPVQSFCLAYKKGNPESYPVKNKKIVYKKEFYLVFILKQNGYFLMRQRNSNEIMSGIWEFPMEVINESFNQDAKVISEIVKNKKWPIGEVIFLKSFTHAIMNRRMVLYPVVIDIPKSRSVTNIKLGENVWKKREELSKVPITTITRKALKFEKEQV